MGCITSSDKPRIRARPIDGIPVPNIVTAKQQITNASQKAARNQLYSVPLKATNPALNTMPNTMPNKHRVTFHITNAITINPISNIATLPNGSHITPSRANSVTYIIPAIPITPITTVIPATPIVPDAPNQMSNITQYAPLTEPTYILSPLPDIEYDTDTLTNNPNPKPTYEFHGEYACPNIIQFPDHCFKPEIMKFYKFIDTCEDHVPIRECIQFYYFCKNNKIHKDIRDICGDRHNDFYVYQVLPANSHRCEYGNCDRHCKHRYPFELETVAYIIYQIIDTTNIVPTIRMHSIVGEHRYDKPFYVQIKYNVLQDAQTRRTHYIYDYYDIYDNHNTLKICIVCYTPELSGCKHCCKCKRNYMLKHCCDCRVSWDITEQHCCTCKALRRATEKHCCACKANYMKYHCCTCGTNYDVFNVGCQCVRNDNKCTICMEDITPKNSFRTVCNKSLICATCCHSLQLCPFCRNPDIKEHILYT